VRNGRNEFHLRRPRRSRRSGSRLPHDLLTEAPRLSGRRFDGNRKMDLPTLGVQLLNGVQYGLVLFLVASGPDPGVRHPRRHQPGAWGILHAGRLRGVLACGLYGELPRRPRRRGGDRLRGRDAARDRVHPPALRARPPRPGALELRADPGARRGARRAVRQGRALGRAASLARGLDPADRLPVLSSLPAASCARSASSSRSSSSPSSATRASA
jgi:hypothetical protein